MIIIKLDENIYQVPRKILYEIEDAEAEAQPDLVTACKQS